jgi:hypothetical protein
MEIDASLTTHMPIQKGEKYLKHEQITKKIKGNY